MSFVVLVSPGIIPAKGRTKGRVKRPVPEPTTVVRLGQSAWGAAVKKEAKAGSYGTGETGPE